jgi:hypothetical protein
LETLNQPYLWDSYVFNDLLVHINEGLMFAFMIKAAEGGNEVDVLGGPSNRGAWDDGRLGRHVEMLRWRG